MDLAFKRKYVPMPVWVLRVLVPIVLLCGLFCCVGFFEPARTAIFGRGSDGARNKGKKDEESTAPGPRDPDTAGPRDHDTKDEVDTRPPPATSFVHDSSPSTSTEVDLAGVDETRPGGVRKGRTDQLDLPLDDHPEEDLADEDHESPPPPPPPGGVTPPAFGRSPLRPHHVGAAIPGLHPFLDLAGGKSLETGVDETIPHDRGEDTPTGSGAQHQESSFVAPVFSICTPRGGDDCRPGSSSSSPEPEVVVPGGSLSPTPRSVVVTPGVVVTPESPAEESEQSRNQRILASLMDNDRVEEQKILEKTRLSAAAPPFVPLEKRLEESANLALVLKAHGFLSPSVTSAVGAAASSLAAAVSDESPDHGHQRATNAGGTVPRFSGSPSSASWQFPGTPSSIEPAGNFAVHPSGNFGEIPGRVDGLQKLRGRANTDDPAFYDDGAPPTVGDEQESREGREGEEPGPLDRKMRSLRELLAEARAKRRSATFGADSDGYYKGWSSSSRAGHDGGGGGQQQDGWGRRNTVGSGSSFYRRGASSVSEEVLPSRGAHPPSGGGGAQESGHSSSYYPEVRRSTSWNDGAVGTTTTPWQGGKGGGQQQHDGWGRRNTVAGPPSGGGGGEKSGQSSSWNNPEVRRLPSWSDGNDHGVAAGTPTSWHGGRQHQDGGKGGGHQENARSFHRSGPERNWWDQHSPSGAAQGGKMLRNTIGGSGASFYRDRAETWDGASLGTRGRGDQHSDQRDHDHSGGQQDTRTTDPWQEDGADPWSPPGRSALGGRVAAAPSAAEPIAASGSSPGSARQNYRRATTPSWLNEITGTASAAWAAAVPVSANHPPRKVRKSWYDPLGRSWYPPSQQGNKIPPPPPPPPPSTGTDSHPTLGDVGEGQTRTGSGDYWDRLGQLLEKDGLSTEQAAEYHSRPSRSGAERVDNTTSPGDEGERDSPGPAYDPAIVMWRTSHGVVGTPEPPASDEEVLEAEDHRAEGRSSPVLLAAGAARGGVLLAGAGTTRRSGMAACYSPEQGGCLLLAGAGGGANQGSLAAASSGRVHGAGVVVQEPLLLGTTPSSDSLTPTSFFPATPTSPFEEGSTPSTSYPPSGSNKSSRKSARARMDDPFQTRARKSWSRATASTRSGDAATNAATGAGAQEDPPAREQQNAAAREDPQTSSSDPPKTTTRFKPSDSWGGIGKDTAWADVEGDDSSDGELLRDARGPPSPRETTPPPAPKRTSSKIAPPSWRNSGAARIWRPRGSGEQYQ